MSDKTPQNAYCVMTSDGDCDRFATPEQQQAALAKTLDDYHSDASASGGWTEPVWVQALTVTAMWAVQRQGEYADLLPCALTSKPVAPVSEHKHTPLVIVREDLGDETVCILPVGLKTADGRTVVAYSGGMAPEGEPWDREDMERWAHLLAAAPVMKEALEELTSILSDSGVDALMRLKAAHARGLAALDLANPSPVPVKED